MAIKKPKITGGNEMKVIDFEEAKARKYSKEKVTKHLPEVNDRELELQRQYRELAQFYNEWYDEHVVGQDEKGGWVYKD